MYDVIIKRGDTRNCIKAVLKGANGSVAAFIRYAFT